MTDERRKELRDRFARLAWHRREQLMAGDDARNWVAFLDELTDAAVEVIERGGGS